MENTIDKVKIKPLWKLLLPLYYLLRKSSDWEWEDAQKQAFNKARKMLNYTKLLVHYNSQKDLFLDCNASPNRIWAILSHKFPEREKPFAYTWTSRTLNSIETGYAQVDKKTLAVIYGVNKFYKYLYLVGRKLTIFTDHNCWCISWKTMGKQISAHVIRWALQLDG